MLQSVLAATAAITVGGSATAVDVVGGQTNVALDFDTLEAAAGLTLSGVSAEVINPGTLPDSVAFPINSRTDTLPTTFAYDPADFLNSFLGTIEHAGTVSFNMNAITVGDFTIGFDGGRVGGDRSGFFVQSTTGLTGILFDVANPSVLTPTPNDLTIQANLLVSSEFSQILNDAMLTSADLTGAVVGEALVAADTPAPGTAALLAGAGLFSARRRR